MDHDPNAELATLPASTPEVKEPTLIGGRFRLGARVDGGSAGALYKAYDQSLRKVVAVKISPVDARSRARMKDRPPLESGFRHPYLVRLLDQGIEGQREWQAMEWVEGGTVADVIHHLHQSEPADPTLRGPTADTSGRTRSETRSDHVADFDLPRALYLLSEAAMGLGAAHRQGLVHLDLKPDNVMFEWRTIRDTTISRVQYSAWLDAPRGRASAVDRVPFPRLIDWGLGRRIVGSDDAGAHPLGVEHYLAPERLLHGRVAPTVDVYALGAILYHLLTGRRPFHDLPREAVRGHVADGGAPTPIELSVRFDPLVRVCHRAMHPDPRDRLADGEAFGRAMRRAQALTILARVDDLFDEARRLRGHAHELRSIADAKAQSIDRASVEARHPIWDLEDGAANSADDADLREAQWLQGVRSVLAIDPTLPEARSRIVEWRCRSIRIAERSHDRRAERIMLEMLKTDLALLEEWAGPVASTVEETRRHARDLLQGKATIDVDVGPDVDVDIARVRMSRRELIVDPPWMALGRGPIVGATTDHGRVLLRLRAPDAAEVLVPARLHRGESWTMHPPGEPSPRPMALPSASGLAADEAYIAAGWAWLGGQPFASDPISPGRRVWFGAFAMKKNPVTNAEWLVFVNDLVARGEERDAERHAPAIPRRGTRMPTYIRDDSGRWVLSGPRVLADRQHHWPVGWISWHSAVAYTRWRSEKDGLDWRLPSEWEFEKVARCNDERRLPWGEHLELSWTRVGGSTDEMYAPVAVDTPTRDETVHGVRWLVGNMQTWCLEPWSFDGPPEGTRLDVDWARSSEANPYRMIRGCHYCTQEYFVSASTRFAAEPEDDGAPAGVRLVRNIPE